MRLITTSTALLVVLASSALSQRHAAVGTPAEAPLSFEAPAPTAQASSGKTLDTLYDYVMRSSGLAQYQYPPDPARPNDFVPVTGTNPIYHVLGQTYDFEGSGRVVGVLVAFSGKQINGAADTLMAEIMECDEKGMPTGAMLAGTYFTTAGIDTGTTMVRLTPILFASSDEVKSNFVALIQTRAFTARQPQDIIGIFSNIHHDGKGENRAVMAMLMPETNEIVGGALSQAFTFDDEPIDIDVAIIPIVEVSAASGIDAPSIGGLRLAGAYPNPSGSQTEITFEVDRAGEVSLDLLDAGGRQVSTTTLTATGGRQQIAVDLTGLAAGRYYYVVRTATTNIAGSLTVVK